MKPVRSQLVNVTTYARIDALPISVTDREFAKVCLRSGDLLADALCNAGTMLRSCAAFVARHIHTTTSPQH